MKFSSVINTITQATGRTTLYARKYSPEILTGAGIVGLVGAGVLASKATLKMPELMTQFREAKETVQYLRDEQSEEAYSSQDHVSDVTALHVVTVKEVIKAYAPAITLGVLGVVSILSAHGIMRHRNVALAAAYKLVEQSFSEYRKRVVEEVGEDKDREYRHGIETVEKKVKGSSEVERTSTMKKPHEYSGYARFFDEGNANWSKNADHNLLFLRKHQQYANDLLISRGHVFLNEIYDELGFERTKAGSVVGWVVSKDGDNYVDFGIYEFNSPQHRAFVNGDERSVLLDFNVDGVIWDQLPEGGVNGR